MSKEFKLADYIIAVSLVPHGYEIDLLDHKSYMNGKVKIVHSECRDYGENIDVEAVSRGLLAFVRNAEDYEKLLEQIKSQSDKPKA